MITISFLWSLISTYIFFISHRLKCSLISLFIGILLERFGHFLKIKTCRMNNMLIDLSSFKSNLVVRLGEIWARSNTSTSSLHASLKASAQFILHYSGISLAPLKFALASSEQGKYSIRSSTVYLSFMSPSVFILFLFPLDSDWTIFHFLMMCHHTFLYFGVVLPRFSTWLVCDSYLLR